MDNGQAYDCGGDQQPHRQGQQQHQKAQFTVLGVPRHSSPRMCVKCVVPLLPGAGTGAFFAHCSAPLARRAEEGGGSPKAQRWCHGRRYGLAVKARVKKPSRADQQLIDHAREHGVTISAKQLARWRRHGLLPANTRGGGLGRGRGSTSQPVAAGFPLVLALARLTERGRRPKDLALALFSEDLPVPEETVRAAFRAAVDTVRLPGIDSDTDNDVEEHLDAVGAYLEAGGQAVVMVPARARKVDEQIVAFFESAGAPWPPPALAALDDGADVERMNPHGATLFAADAVLTGRMTLEGLGSLLRATMPSPQPNPIASLVETTVKDVEDSAVLSDDGALATLSGDARLILHEMAATASRADLYAAWHTARNVRAWALDLCAQAEAELAAHTPADAVMEWCITRQMPAGVFLLEELRTRHESATATALSALGLLLQRAHFAEVDRVQPGCQWDVARAPGMLPPPVLAFLSLPASTS